MMVRFDQQFCSLKNKLDHVTPPQKEETEETILYHIGRRWRGSHALYQGTSAHKDHHTTLLLYSGSLEEI